MPEDEDRTPRPGKTADQFKDVQSNLRDAAPADSGGMLVPCEDEECDQAPPQIPEEQAEKKKSKAKVKATEDAGASKEEIKAKTKKKQV